MDLNYLLSRHQLSLLAADNAASPEARMAHRGLAKGYGDRVRALQIAMGATSRLATVR
ncbi:hypothetical protein [Sphingomonas gilva]|uniref:hypothetical protein n=1 Tax=Sphingomonas gilva TaxID=2305907 RepID=UPI0015FB9345|nr:hypothetical protein [Sphingomonas gilva]